MPWGDIGGAGRVREIGVRGGCDVGTPQGAVLAHYGNGRVIQVVRAVAFAGVEEPGIDLVAEILPPMSACGRRGCFKIVRLTHLHANEHQVAACLFANIVVHQTIDLFGVGDDKRLA